MQDILYNVVFNKTKPLQLYYYKLLSDKVSMQSLCTKALEHWQPMNCPGLVKRRYKHNSFNATRTFGLLFPHKN